MTTTTDLDDQVPAAPVGDNRADTNADTGAAPSAGSGSRRRSWLLPCLTGVLLVAVLATALALRSTNQSIDTTHQQLDERAAQTQDATGALGATNADVTAQRLALAQLIGTLQQTQDQLDAKSTQRDAVASQAEQARVELYNLRSSLNAKNVKIYLQSKLLASLQTCLRSADLALNALSVGQTDLGRGILRDAAAACKAVDDYLAKEGVTT